MGCSGIEPLSTDFQSVANPSQLATLSKSTVVKVTKHCNHSPFICYLVGHVGIEPTPSD